MLMLLRLPYHHPPSLSFPWIENIKHTIQTYIRLRYNSSSASLLELLLLGNSRTTSSVQELRLLGLAHLIAISGWHFSLLSSLLHASLRFLPLVWKNGVLLLIMTTYCLFLGFSPSIIRAYTATCFCVISSLCYSKYEPLHSLSWGFIVLAISFPHTLHSIGAVLSFLSTLGIILFYAPLSTYLLRTLTLPLPRWLHHVQVGVLRSCALYLAVHMLITLPLLYFMHTLPIEGFFYSLWVPFCLIAELICFGISTIGECMGMPFLHGYTNSMISIMFDILSLRVFPHLALYASVSLIPIMIWSCIASMWGLYQRKKDPFVAVL